MEEIKEIRDEIKELVVYMKSDEFKAYFTPESILRFLWSAIKLAVRFCLVVIGITCVIASLNVSIK